MLRAGGENRDTLSLSLSLSYYWVPIVLSGTLGTHFAEVVIGEN